MMFLPILMHLPKNSSSQFIVGSSNNLSPRCFPLRRLLNLCLHALLPWVAMTRFSPHLTSPYTLLSHFILQLPASLPSSASSLLHALLTLPDHTIACIFSHQSSQSWLLPSVLLVFLWSLTKLLSPLSGHQKGHTAFLKAQVD